VIYGGADHGNTLYSINTSNGALTAVGTGNIGGGYALIGSAASGLYALGWDDDLYSINAATGAATEIGPTGIPFGTVMGISAGSNTLYVTSNNSLYALNTTNGSATFIGSTTEGESGFGALLSVGGTLYSGAYGASTPHIYTLDPQSGAATFVAASPSTPSSPGVAGFWGLAPIPQQTQTATYDVVHDFNATGTQPAVGDPFTYGTETSLNVGLTLLPYYGNTSSSVGGGSTTTDGTVNNYYFAQPYEFSGPSIAVVATGNTLTFPAGPPLIVPDDVLAMCAGSPDLNAPDLIVTRFTAPSAGIFGIAGSFTDLQQASVDLTIVTDGTTVFSSSFSGQSAYQGTIPFSITGISLHAGDTIDFVVDSLGEQSCDNVGLKAQITETSVIPTLTLITAATDNGASDLNSGHVVTISISLSEAAYVTGNPYLLLNDNEIATYATGSGTNILKFTYTVQPGDNTPDLQVTGLNLNGGTIQDGGGTALSGPVQGDLSLHIDTIAPATPAAPGDSAVVNGYVTVYTISLPPTGDLTLTGTITTDGNLGTLTRADILDWDLTVHSASLSAGFEFLGPGHGSAVNSTLRLDSDGGRSPDGAVATATTLTLPSPIYVFDLEDTNRGTGLPFAQAVVPGTGAEYFRLDTADGRYDEVEIKVPFPLQLADAGVQLLVPRFVNAANDTAAQVLTGTAENSSTVTIYDNGNFVGSTAADPSTGSWSFPIGQLPNGSTHSYTVTATDAAGNVSQPSAALNFLVDTTIPAVTAVAETPGSGDLNAGKTVTITLTTSEAVTVTGTPTLALDDNGTATYDAGKSTATSLVFDYTVGSSDTDVPSLQVTSLNLPSGTTIQDGAGNNLNLSPSAVPTYSGPQIDTTPPATPAAPTDIAAMATLNTLVSFNGSNGLFPWAGLMADPSGNLFGTTNSGGMYGDGTVFEVVKTASGYASTPITLVNFNGSNGASPYTNLIADAYGDLPLTAGCMATAQCSRSPRQALAMPARPSPWPASTPAMVGQKPASSLTPTAICSARLLAGRTARYSRSSRQRPAMPAPSLPLSTSTAPTAASRFLAT